MKYLFKDINFLETLSKQGEIEDACVVVDDNVITYVGKVQPEGKFDRIVDCSNMVMLPGFVNTHHHFYQTLTRNVKSVQSAKLFDWLVNLYEIWKNLDEESSYVSATIASCEMALSGVTTSSDMLYLYPYGRNAIFDEEIKGVSHVGLRFHPTRGSMSMSKKDGGLPPDSVVQNENEILSEYERVISKYHDRSKYAMTRIALAPCSPFSVTESLMIKTLEMAKKHGVLLHTHLAETKDEEEFCLEKFGLRPVDYMEKLGWLNPQVWFAHTVHVSDRDIEKMKANDVGISHCPTSNMRLGSGIAPISKMKGMRLSLGIDGSASNDTSNMILEARNAMLLQRVKYGPDAMTPKEALEMASMGGARVLRMDDYIGSIEVGKAADLVMFDMNKLAFAGGLDDPVGAIIMCDAQKVNFNMVNGRVIVEDGNLKVEDIDYLIKRQNEISRKLLKG
ncbi:8-oxoguanine deaminase [Athalassotoga sp.]|uniref:8-oxoguanine deaminase n=1 Tax=Athalassotoga sp. TaxID=2022597 RepID=UPI003D015FF3